jgi:hypothetical protein
MAHIAHSAVRPAIRRLRGYEGESMRCSTIDRAASVGHDARVQRGGDHLRRSHTTIVCLPESDRPYRTKLTISVGQTGPCDEERPLN